MCESRATLSQSADQWPTMFFCCSRSLIVTHLCISMSWCLLPTITKHHQLALFLPLTTSKIRAVNSRLDFQPFSAISSHFQWFPTISSNFKQFQTIFIASRDQLVGSRSLLLAHCQPSNQWQRQPMLSFYTMIYHADIDSHTPPHGIPRSLLLSFTLTTTDANFNGHSHHGQSEMNL